MTEKEFFSMSYGTVVSDRFNKEEYYVIDCVDVFGVKETNKDAIVYGASSLEGSQTIRINKSNAQFWKIEGRMVETT